MAQEFRLDHISLHVRDLAASARFYGEVLGLTEIPNGAGHAHVRWFGVDSGHSIHLISGAPEQRAARPIAEHYALGSHDFENRLKSLSAAGIAYGDYAGRKGHIGLRADGVRSVYLQDPDDHWIEILDAKTPA